MNGSVNLMGIAMEQGAGQRARRALDALGAALNTALGTFALALMLLMSGFAQAAWSPAGAGLESLTLAGKPTLLALPGTGSNLAAAGGAPRVLIAADEAPAGLRFIDPDNATEQGFLAIPGKPIALALDSNGTRAYLITGERRLHLIDLASRSLSASYPLDGDPKALLLRESGGAVVEILIAQTESLRLIGLDPANGTLLRSITLDQVPAALAWGGANRILLGAQSGKLSVLDDASLALLSSGQIGDEIRHLDWWEGGAQALVVHKKADGVSLLDLASGQVSAFVALDGDPQKSVQDAAAERLFVTTAADFSVNRVHLARRSLEGRYALPAAASGAVFDPLSARLLLSQRTEGKILRLDPAQASLISALNLNRRLRAIAVNPASHEALAVADKIDELTRIKLADRSASSLALPARPLFVAVDSALNLGIVGLKNKQVRFVDLAPTPPALLAAGVTLPDEPGALAVDPTRNLTLSLTEPKKNLHFIANGATPSLLGSLNLGEDAHALAVHSGRGLAYLLTDKKKLLLINLDDRSLRQSIALPFRGADIALDAARDRAVITTDLDNKVYVLDLSTLSASTTGLNAASFTQSHILPRVPGAVALQLDSGLALIASMEANVLSTLDLDTATLTPGFVTLPKPFALAVSSRYNQALALLAERDEVAFVRLPNPVPRLDALSPTEAASGSPALTLTLTGQRFIDDSRVYAGGTLLTTRWLSHTRLEADLPASLLASAATLSITVNNPSPAGGASNALSFNVLAAPILAALSPNTAGADGQAKALTLTGQHFRPGATVLFGATTLTPVFNGATSLSLTLPGALTQSAGTVNVTVINANGQTSNSLPFVLTPALSINTLTPDNGPVGTPVTLGGIGFDPNSANNDVRFNGERALVVTATANQLRVIVPARATTGRVTLTTVKGTATSLVPFTVKAQQDFDLALEPAVLQLPRGGSATTRVRVISTGLSAYSHGVAIAVTGLPAGISYRVEPVLASTASSAFVTFTAAADAASTAFTATINGSGNSDTIIVSRAKSINLSLMAAGTTTVSGRVLHADDDTPFVNARIRLGTQTVFTDAAGYYRFDNPGVSGDQVVLIDGHTNNTSAIEYPSAIAMPVMIVAGKDNRVLTSYIQAVDATKFTAITPGSAATVTDPDLPGYALNIPPGAVLMGWNGQPIDKVSVRTVPVDRLPIKPVPAGVTAKTVYLYYFFREGGANPSVPIPVTMANDLAALPGEKVDMWYYDESITPDPNSNQWRIMGQGTVSADGKSVVSDPGVGIPKFCCGASFNSPSPPPQPPGSCPAGPSSPNPVVYGTGAATVMEEHSLGLNSLFPVRIGCQYNSLTDRIGSFGRGTWLNTEWQLALGTESMVLISAAGHRWVLSKDANGIFRTIPGRVGAYGVEAWVEGATTIVRFTDGTRYEFAGFARANLALVAQVDANGNRITLTRGNSGTTNALLLSVTDATGRVYRIDYAGNLISKLTDPIGRTLSFAYDAASRLTQVTDTAGRITRYDYDAAHRIIKKTDALGAATHYEYDANGRAVKETFADGAAYRFAYIVAGGMVMETKVTDPLGHLGLYRFNGLGDWTRHEDALGRVIHRRLDAATNLVLSETDAAGRITRYTYDARGNRSSVRDPVGSLTQYLYHPSFAKVGELIDPLGNRTRYDYDGRGNLSALTGAAGQVTRYAYATNGTLQSITDALGHVTAFEYDAEGKRLATIDALGNRSGTAWDTANRVAQETSARGETVRYAYDVLDRLIAATDAQAGLTRYTYDALGKLTSVTNALDRVIERRAYDARHRLIERQDATGARETFQYDANGRLTRHTDRRGQASVFEYDAAGRTVAVTDGGGRTTRTFYDLAGNVSRLSDSVSGDILIQYDAAHRPLQVSTDQGALGYQYDAAGRRTKMTINGGDAVDTAYDQAGRLTTLSYRNQTTAYAWDAANRLIRKTLPNGIQQEFTWDAANNLLALTYKKPGGTAIETISYTYDANGQRLSKTSGATSVSETPFSAAYDAANRLTSITLTATNQSFDLTYDANGNLTAKTERGNPANVTAYAWDSRNRLTAISAPGLTASFTYDALGRRTGKTVNGQSIGYLYDGQQAVAELQGNAISATLLSGLALDEVIARYNQLGNRTYLTDALGSVIAQARDDQSIQNYYAYSPYGETQTLGPDEGNAIQYTGRENDQTGLYYYRARYYDAVLKRFISEDPIGLQAGTNFYTYVGGNPISYTDPTGEFAIFLPALPAIASALAQAGTALAGGLAIAAILSTPGDTPESDLVPKQQPFNPGRDCTGKCNPCPPPIYWDAPGNKHGSTSGTHVHGIVWNQNPSTCMCYPTRVSGPSFGNTR